MSARTFPDRLARPTWRTLLAAFDAQSDVLAREGPYSGKLNPSAIVTKIIQDTGRFAERFASDAVYGIEDILDFSEADAVPCQGFDALICFGIRRDGVDHDNWIMSRLMDGMSPRPNGYIYPTKDYRRVLIARAEVRGRERTLTLKDVTDKFIRIDPRDLDGNGALLPEPTPYDHRDNDESEANN